MPQERTCAVVAVQSGYPDAQVFVDLGNPDEAVRLTCTSMWYEPQTGDNVLIRWVGTMPYVAHNFTPGRNPDPLAVSVVVVDPGSPTGGYEAVSSVYLSDHGVLGVRPTAAPPPTAGTNQFPALSSRTWDPTNNWDSRSQDVRQGSFSGIGAATGLWFHGDLATQLAGRTVTGATVHVRRGNGGTGAARPLHLVLHGYQAQPGFRPSILASATGPSLVRGQSADVTLPDGWAAQIAAGTAAGVGISDGTADNYLIVDGVDASPTTSGLLTFAYSA